MGNKRVYLSSPTMHGDEQKFIKEAFDTNWVSPLGENVNQFEKELAAYIGVGYGAALSAGTAAIHLAIKLAGVKTGDIVFCQDLTFAASATPVSYENAVQVFIDSERDTWNMDPKALEAAFKKYPSCKAVIVVNLYGTPAKLDEIKKICDKNGAVLIEDAAESLSSVYKGKQTGTYGKYNVISFNGNKLITSSGGGMLLSDDGEAIKKARFWATQSREPAPYYHHCELGYNYRMSNIVAGIGRGQIPYIDHHKAIKKYIFSRYKKAFSDLPVTMSPCTKDSDPNRWLSCILINEGVAVSPYDIINELAKENIESRPIWKPMHMQPVFADKDFITVADEPVSEDIFRRGLCLPSDIKMTDEEIDSVIALVRKFF